MNSNKLISSLQFAVATSAPRKFATGDGSAPPAPTPPPTPPAPPPSPDAATQALIDAAVAEQVKGLKAKNQELAEQNKQVKASLARFDGIDPDVVNAMLKRFADDEEAALIKDGKIDEVLSKRTDRMKADHAKQLQAKDEELSKRTKAAQKLADRALSDAIVKAASKSGALPDALDDIVLRAKAAGWTVNDDGDVVAVADGAVVLGKDGKTALTPQEWAESLRESAAHLWPKGQGGGGSGSGGGGGTPGKGNVGGSREDRANYFASKFNLPKG